MESHVFRHAWLFPLQKIFYPPWVVDSVDNFLTEKRRKPMPKHGFPVAARYFERLKQSKSKKSKYCKLFSMPLWSENRLEIFQANFDIIERENTQFPTKRRFLCASNNWFEKSKVLGALFFVPFHKIFYPFRLQTIYRPVSFPVVFDDSSIF